jgi:ferredoxin-NADP reductase
MQPAATDVPPDRLALTCRAIRRETPSIKTFVFEADGPFDHEAGQALTLAVPADGEALLRTFSIASAPDAGGLIEVTIKAQPDGRATRWLHSVLMPGDILEARRPRGRFTLARRRPAAPIAFVSAGSGATPLMAMLRELARTEPEANVAWFHAARDEGEILFAGELALLQTRMPNLTVAVTLTAPAPGWFGYRGRPTRRLLSVTIPDLAARDLFCCGPHGFATEIKLIHAAEGGLSGRYHTEAFHPLVPLAAVTTPLPVLKGAEFQLRIGDRTLTTHGGETVLQAALRQGVVIPCGCGQGLCGTCRVELISGAVDLRHQGGLGADEEREGFILACSSRAKTDLSIRL